MSTARRLLVLVLISVGLAVPASAGATVVTIGSPLTTSLPPQPINGGPLSIINSQMPDLGANVVSPISGTVVRWRITGAVGGPFKLRVVTPHGDGTTTFDATSAPQTPTGTGTLTFATNLPIKAGDSIALDTAKATGDQIGANTSLAGASLSLFIPPPANGTTLVPTSSQGTTEIGFNADVGTIPSNAYSFDGVAVNKKNGTATLAVVVPGPGTLALTGKGVKKQRTGRGATASKNVTSAGLVNLKIKAKGKAKKKLKKTGRAKVKVKVTYTPTGDAPGVPSTKTKSVKLITG
jgi:hypothetical protein